jgi:hypothetical protein
MGYIDNSSLRIFRSVERDSRSSRGLFVKCVGMYLELNVGELEGFVALGLIVDASNLNVSDMIFVLELV